jgi:hypothetical protein
MKIAIQIAVLVLTIACADLATAQTNSGFMHVGDQGVPEDHAQTMQQYRSAAERGNANAQYFLGLKYADGQGVPQDYVQAHMWFSLAALAGDPDAVKSRDLVAARMGPAQIAEARKRAREWKPTRP